MGKLLIAVGMLLVLGGLALTYAPWLTSWFGNLPGDIKIKREHSFIFIPIASTLVLSVLLTLLLNLFFRR